MLPAPDSGGAQIDSLCTAVATRAPSHPGVPNGGTVRGSRRRLITQRGTSVPNPRMPIVDSARKPEHEGLIKNAPRGGFFKPFPKLIPPLPRPPPRFHIAG